MPGFRSFIAIELPASVRQRLNEVELQLQTRCGEMARRVVRWTPVGNLHLTLKFLGDVPSQQMPALIALLQEESANHATFDLLVSGLGVFPNPRRPRVVWVGCDGGPALGDLVKALDCQTARLGFAREERPFLPHLTLGRVADGAREEDLMVLVRALSETQVAELARVPVEVIHLFRSDLRPAGPIYTTLGQFALSAAAPEARPGKPT